LELPQLDIGDAIAKTAGDYYYSVTHTANPRGYGPRKYRGCEAKTAEFPVFSLDFASFVTQSY
jgi:hypothetical protein